MPAGFAPAAEFVTLLLCLLLISLAYAFAGRRIHTQPAWLLVLGLWFMVSAIVLYHYALPDATMPITISIAAIGGNLVASAIIARAGDMDRRWRGRMKLFIARQVDKRDALRRTFNTLPPADPHAADLLHRIADVEEVLADLERAISQQ